MQNWIQIQVQAVYMCTPANSKFVFTSCTSLIALLRSSLFMKLLLSRYNKRIWYDNQILVGFKYSLFFTDRIQEPITRSRHTNCTLESTLFRIFLLLELRYVKGEGGIFFNFLRKHADVRIIAQKNGKLSALFTVIFSPLRTIFFSRRY